MQSTPIVMGPPITAAVQQDSCSAAHSWAYLPWIQPPILEASPPPSAFMWPPFIQPLLGARLGTPLTVSCVSPTAALTKHLLLYLLSGRENSIP